MGASTHRRLERRCSMIQPNTEDLKSAATVALGFMTLGAQAIDRKFGEGHAANNPALLAAFMLAAALSFERSTGEQ